MRTSKKGRGELRVGGTIPQAVALAVSMWPALVSLAAAADLPAAKRSAQEQVPSAKHGQQTETELKRLAKEAEHLEGAGKLAEAIAVGEKASGLALRLYGNESEPVAAQQEVLARLHEKREEWQAARHARQDVQIIRTKLYGEKDWRVTDARLALEQTVRLSQMDAAQCRELIKATSLKDEVDRLRNKKGQYGQAVPLAENALAIHKKVLGESNRDYADRLDDLAILTLYLGEYAKAQLLYRQELAIYKKVLGEAHPDYARALNGLACVYHEQGDYLKAEPLYLQAVATLKKALGQAHPDYGLGLHNIANLYRGEGEYAKAEQLYLQSVAVQKKALSAEHPEEAAREYARSLLALATIYRLKGDFSEAEPLFRQALAITKRALGEAAPALRRKPERIGLFVL